MCNIILLTGTGMRKEKQYYKDISHPVVALIVAIDGSLLVNNPPVVPLLV